MRGETPTLTRVTGFRPKIASQSLFSLPDQHLNGLVLGQYQGIHLSLVLANPALSLLQATMSSVTTARPKQKNEQKQKRRAAQMLYLIKLKDLVPQEEKAWELFVLAGPSTGLACNTIRANLEVIRTQYINHTQ